MAGYVIHVAYEPAYDGPPIEENLIGCYCVAKRESGETSRKFVYYPEGWFEQSVKEQKVRDSASNQEPAQPDGCDYRDQGVPCIRVGADS